MGFIDKLSGASFKKEVQAAASDGLTPSEFKSLRAEFAQLNNLAKYAVSSWIAGSYPGLEGALRMPGNADQAYQTYQAAGGVTSDE